MATIEELGNALKNADAAGDTAAAKELASAITQMQNAPQPTNKPDSPSFADHAMNIGGAINKAGMDLIDMPVAMGNVLTKGVADVFGAESYPKAMLPSEALKEVPVIGDAVSKGTGRFIPKGESLVADMLRTGTEWSAGGLLNAPAKAGKFGATLSNIGKNLFTDSIGTTAKKVATAPFKAPVNAVKAISKSPDLLSGVGAAVGEQIDGTTGEVIGGMMGMLGGARNAAKVAAPKDLDDGTVNFIMANAENPEMAIANIKDAVARGERGNLAELSRDRGIFNVVESSNVKGSTLDWKLRDETAKRNQQISDQSGQVFGEGDDLVPLVNQRKAEVQNSGEKIIDERLNLDMAEAEKLGEFDPQYPKELEAQRLAEEDLTKLQQQVSTDVKPSVAGQQLEGTISGEEAKFNKAEVKPAWDEFAGQKQLYVEDVKDFVTNAKDNLNPTDLKMLEDNFGKELSYIENWDQAVSPDEVASVISQIKAVRANAKSNKNSDFSHAILGDVEKSLVESLKELGDNPELYKKAVAKTKEKYDRYGSGRIGKQRDIEPQTYGQRTIKTAVDDAGAAIGDLLRGTKSPYVVKKAEQYIKSMAKRDGVDDKFLANYDELLDRFPELKGQLEQVKAAQDKFASSGKAVDKAKVADLETEVRLTKSVQKAKDEANKSAKEKQTNLTQTIDNLGLNSLQNAPKKTLDKALTGEGKELSTLVKQMNRVKGGKQALRAAVKDRYLNKIKNNKGKVDPNSINEFHQMKRQLIESEILTKKEVLDLERLMERAEVGGLRKSAGINKTKQADDAMADILSSAGAITALGLLPASNQLMLAGTVKRLLRSKLKSEANDQKVLVALEEMITNPKKFLEGVADKKITTESDLSKYINSYINANSQSVAEDE